MPQMAVAPQALGPEVKRLDGGDAMYHSVHHPATSCPSLRVWELEEREIRSGLAVLISVEQVIDAGVVLVDRLGRETEPEDLGVERDVPARVCRD
jgi:hypothetical protein